MDISDTLKTKLKNYKENNHSNIDIEVYPKDKSLSIALDTFAFSLKSLTIDVIEFFNNNNFECAHTNRYINKNPILQLEGNQFTLHMSFFGCATGNAYSAAPHQRAILKLIN